MTQEKEQRVSFSDIVNVAEEDPRELFRNPINLESLQFHRTKPIILPSKPDYQNHKSHIAKKCFFAFLVISMICWIFDRRLISPEASMLKKFKLDIDIERFNTVEKISMILFLLYCLPID